MRTLAHRARSGRRVREDTGSRSSSGSRASPRSTGSAGSSRASSRSSCCRSTRAISARAASAQIETSSRSRPCSSIVLRGGISSAFFRFYFDSDDEAQRLLVVRTSFWFTMGDGDARARRRARCSPGRSRDARSASTTPWLVRAGVRRALGADELRAADGALPRRGAAGRRSSIASLANVADHDRRDGRARRRRSTRARSGASSATSSARSPSTSRCSPTAATSSGSQFDRRCCAR